LLTVIIHIKDTGVTLRHKRDRSQLYFSFLLAERKPYMTNIPYFEQKNDN